MGQTLSYYSIRQLSPFVGTIQIVEGDYCRALSSDGQHWQIQASCETHQQKWAINDERYTPRRYVLYGSWHKDTGLSTLPLDPMLDVPDPASVKESLIKKLKHCEAKLPFPQLDHYECWLLDSDRQQPLALLASATHEVMIPHVQRNNWLAIPQQEQAQLSNHSLKTSAAEIENYINQHNSGHCWIKNKPQQTPRPIDSACELTLNTPLPELLVNSELLPDSLSKAYEELIDWQSPRLLSLHNLSDATRQQLEQLAQHHAQETFRRSGIYPQPLQQSVLNKISVELKIRGL